MVAPVAQIVKAQVGLAGCDPGLVQLCPSYARIPYEKCLWLTFPLARGTLPLVGVTGFEPVGNLILGDRICGHLQPCD